jgi:hypothetical protein
LFVFFLFSPGYIWHLKHSHSKWHDPFFLHTRPKKKQKNGSTHDLDSDQKKRAKEVREKNLWWCHAL